MPSLIGGAMVRSLTVVNPVNGRTAGALTRIDTGDDVALLDPSIIQTLGLVPQGSVTVEGVDGQPVQAQLYTVDVSLGPDGYAANVQVAGYPGLASTLGVGLLTGDTLLDRGFLWRDGPGRQWGFTVVGGLSAPAPVNPWAVAGGALGLVGLAAVVVALRK